MVNPILQIKDLTVSFPQDNIFQTVVENLNFSLSSNEVVAIVGESGSGKTVTSLSILKLLQANNISTGQILFNKDANSINLLKASEKQIRAIRGKDISMIFQEPMSSLNPLMKVGNQVSEAILSHEKQSKKDALLKTINLFKKVGLPTPELLVKKYPHQLSGGQKQRVMIAMAISCNPAVLIADEPTTALDVTVQKTIIKLLKSLQQENGMSILYITHDLNLVTEIADRVIVMLKGKIVESGTVAQIFSSPQHAYTKALLNGSAINKTKRGKLIPISHHNIIEVKNLSVKYTLKSNFFGKKQVEQYALDNIAFNIKQGEILGVVGESGSGKTTLGRSLIGLIKPASGSILFNGVDITKLSKKAGQENHLEMQIVFQDPYGSLNPRLSIGRAIEEPIKVHQKTDNKSERLKKVNELLQKVNLDPQYFTRYPHQFSGGQRQRICIARTLALNPKFIIFDESVSALDVSIQAQILNLINELKDQLGFTCLFISHDLNIVRYMSDRIMVLKNGHIEEIGPSEEIYMNPSSEYTKQLINSIPQNKFAN